MKVSQKSAKSSVVDGAAERLKPLEVAMRVWRLLQLLFSGLASVLLYIVTPLTMLHSRHAYALSNKRGRKCGEKAIVPNLRLRSPVGRRWLLHPLPASELGKMTVVLDLDETLISSHEADKVPPSLRSRAVSGGLRTMELTCEGKSSRVVMFLRPGVSEFLQRLMRFSEVVLFTAGVPAYAEPLANALDPARRFFAARLYRDDTVHTVWHSYVKDLSRLGRDLRRTVMVDNSPFSFLLQPANGIPCVPFKGRAGDQQLLKVILPLLECLSHLRDIRPVLNNHFKMASWFRARGCNVQLDFTP